jgi:hypothetical protein
MTDRDKGNRRKEIETAQHENDLERQKSINVFS